MAEENEFAAMPPAKYRVRVEVDLADDEENVIRREDGPAETPDDIRLVADVVRPTRSHPKRQAPQAGKVDARARGARPSNLSHPSTSDCCSIRRENLSHLTHCLE